MNQAAYAPPELIAPSYLASLAWPLDAALEAMALLAQRAGYEPREADRHDWSGVTPEMLGERLAGAAGWFELEAEPIHVTRRDAHRFLQSGGPALLKLELKDGQVLLMALAGRAGRRLRLIGPDLREHRVPVETVRAALFHSLEAPVLADIERVLDQMELGGRARGRTQEALLTVRLERGLDVGWLIRPLPGRRFWRSLRLLRIERRLGLLVGAHAAQYALGLLSWWIVGQAALLGRIDAGFGLAFVLIVFSLVPFRLLASWISALISVDVGAFIKQQLMADALLLEPERVRQHGAGSLLSLVIESEAIETLAISGAFLGVMALVELTMTTILLGSAVAASLAALLTAAGAAVGGLLWRYWHRRRRWAELRITMTNVLIEAMVGHRTRLAQEDVTRWHDREDAQLAGYLMKAAAMDRAQLWLSLLPRSWLLAGVLGLAPTFIAGDPLKLGIGLGCVLLAFRSLTKLSASASRLIGASIAWQQVEPLLSGAHQRREQTGVPATFAAPPTAVRPGERVLCLADVVFGYHAQREPVLRGVSLEIRSGDRLLLEGPSGGGKSSLAAIITGLRKPASGLLLARGLDPQTVGHEGWRRTIGAAPQFHDNHVFSGTFAFNLLMGRRGVRTGDPALEREALALCEELGLGPLLERMPAGLQQLVGETGWQLSHGEKSRLYIARALMQQPELIIFDESFAALDPETLAQVLDCTLKRARTLLVIAHP